MTDQAIRDSEKQAAIERLRTAAEQEQREAAERERQRQQEQERKKREQEQREQQAFEAGRAWTYEAALPSRLAALEAMHSATPPLSDRRVLSAARSTETPEALATRLHADCTGNPHMKDARNFWDVHIGEPVPEGKLMQAFIRGALAAWAELKPHCQAACDDKPATGAAE